MAARRQNRICFIRLKNNMGLFVSYSAFKTNSDGKRENDKLTVLDPNDGTCREYEPEDLAVDIGVDNIDLIVDRSEVKELIMVCIDTSGSMSLSFCGGSRLDAAKAFFRRLAAKAYDFKVDNLYGLIQFATD